MDGLLDLLAKLPPSVLRTEAVKQLAFEQAKKLSANKGIVNLGSGYIRSPFASSVAHSPQVKLNVDISSHNLPNFLRWNLEQTPYPFGDKEFDVVFASHVLEHLRDWSNALEEMKRIADWVVIAIPHPLDFFAVINPQHKQHFSSKTISELTDINILIYY